MFFQEKGDDAEVYSQGAPEHGKQPPEHQFAIQMPYGRVKHEQITDGDTYGENG